MARAQYVFLLMRRRYNMVLMVAWACIKEVHCYGRRRIQLFTSGRNVLWRGLVSYRHEKSSPREVGTPEVKICNGEMNVLVVDKVQTWKAELSRSGLLCIPCRGIFKSEELLRPERLIMNLRSGFDQILQMGS